MIKRGRAKILVDRSKVTDDHLSPSSIELYDTMLTITSCAEAISKWEADWVKCPVCGGTYAEDVLVVEHKQIERH